MKYYIYRDVDTEEILALPEPLAPEAESGDEVQVEDGPLFIFLGVVEASNPVELTKAIHNLTEGRDNE